MWVCLAKNEVPKPKQVKIGPKTIGCIFVGYANKSSAYLFLVHTSNIQDREEVIILDLRNAFFL